jgi:hypothetical protein
MPAQGIPASQLADVIPSVLAAGGSGLDLISLVLTTSIRPPIGVVLSFPDPDSVGAFFGLNSPELAIANVYFQGFDGSSILPGALLFAQYPWASAVKPYLRGGPIGSQLTLAQLKAIAPGDLTITINGVAYTSSSINLAGATSFSNAAAIIATALDVSDAAFTGVIAAETGAFTGSIADDILTLSVIASGIAVVGGVLSGTGVATGTEILEQLTGPVGGVGTYLVSIGGQSVSSTTIDETYGQLTASSVTGSLSPGQVIAGAGVTAGSTITADIGGSGGAGTYVVNPSQAVSSEAMTAGAANVSFDSVSEAFVIFGGTPGTPGTIGFGSGAIATALDLTAATGASLSQGAPEASPVSFMTSLFDGFQNFGSFFTTFAPSQGDAISFAQWTSALGTEVAYIFWDESIANTSPDPDTAYAAIEALNLNGTIAFYAPVNGVLDAAFVGGYIASLNFSQTNGRYNLAFRSQEGLPAEVLTGSAAAQLEANGVNFYGTFSTPSEGYTEAYPGTISGQFLWVDSFVNACWFKNLLQNAIMLLLRQVGNIPYNAAGYALIAETLGGGPATNGADAGPIQQALNFGAIRIGITLSSNQIAALNNQAGPGAAATLVSQGWFLQITPASPATRQARGSPTIILWYTDGQSVQKITLQSINVQ